MVNGRIATGETTAVSTAAVLRCGKRMEKLPHYYFSWTVSFQKFGRGYGPVARQTTTSTTNFEQFPCALVRGLVRS
jgi:hypothetical protein